MTWGLLGTSCALRRRHQDQVHTACVALMRLGARWITSGTCETRPGPRAQVRCGGEPGYLQPDLGDHHVCRGHADSGNLIESPDGLGERGDQLLDLGLDCRDVGAGLVGIARKTASDAGRTLPVSDSLIAAVA